jgi:uncharacterized repeat protein (TIGR03803 family)
MAPESGLTYFKGTLYGTTPFGGSYKCPRIGTCGTVYSITPSGTETVLHSFKGGDGADPEARMIVRSGTFYGTAGGGAYKNGAVFSITPSGHETVLYAFTGPPDGSAPIAPLHNVNGTLYGTTDEGGSFSRRGWGTVFSITPGGEEKVLHSFGRGSDGREPRAGLIDVNGTLYGTTYSGGNYIHISGTVFSITPGGNEKVLYTFGAHRDDGNLPQAGLVDVSGTLYGTTSGGGNLKCQDQYGHGCGTVFSITPSGTETVLHSFSGGDGAAPEATLLNVNGTLYGTTLLGGAYNRGTVFSIARSGHETVLHSFGSGQDGSYPVSGVIDVNGTLYGTTDSGGAHNLGTVYSITL